MLGLNNPVAAFVLDAFRAAGVSPPEGAGPSMSMAEIGAMFAAAQRDDPDIGVVVGAHARFQPASPVAYLMMSSATMGTALEGLCRFSMVLQRRRAQMRVVQEGDRVSLRWRSPDGGGRAYAEFIAATFLHLGRWLTGQEIAPQAIRFRHPPPANLGPRRAAFGVTPAYGDPDENALIFDRATWDTPSRGTDPALYRLHREFLETSERRLQEDALTERLRQLVDARLGDASVELHDLAPRLGVSPRTLQRRLKARGVRYSELLDDARRERAMSLLRASDASLEAIALSAGFSDASALHRAFQRWTGESPGAWRERERG